jgi:hypothetical protein
MMSFWHQSLSATVEEGFGFTRAVGEMTWALKDMPGVEELVRYESELNRFLPLYEQVILCLYDLDHFGGELLVEILKTHPLVLMGSTVLDNPYHLTPDEYLTSVSEKGFGPTPAASRARQKLGLLECLACGQGNRAKARFCDNCGEPFKPPDRDGRA